MSVTFDNPRMLILLLLVPAFYLVGRTTRTYLTRPVRTAMLVAGQYRAGDSATGRLILTYDLFAIAGAGQPFHLYDEGSKAELGADFVKTFVLSARLR